MARRKTGGVTKLLLPDKTLAWEVNRQAESLEVPEEGKKVMYLEKEFIVYHGVFQPCEDSIPLVDIMDIYPGSRVLDVCTGCGNIAVFAKYKGAGNVVALDIMPNAVRAARENAKAHGFGDTIDVRLSDMFEALKDGEEFHVITANLPSREMDARDIVEGAMWDTRLRTHLKFFNDAERYLALDGKIYITQSDFGAVDAMKALADNAGFDVKLVEASGCMEDVRVFYAFELTRKVE